jgi:hypothetical protein
MFRSALIILFLIFVSGCARITRSTNSSSQNNPPISPPDCSTPTACNATLTWDPSDTSAGQGIPTGYRVYYGTAPGGYTTNVDVSLNLTHAIPAFIGPNTYYFAVTAYNAEGESVYSSEVSKVFPACCTGGTFTLNIAE